VLPRLTSSGQERLIWKSDGDCCDEATFIHTQQLSSDGLSTVGPPQRLLGATQPWEAAALASAGVTACAALGQKKSDEQIVAMLKAHTLSTYEAYVAIILSAQYRCAARIPEATRLMVDALNQLLSTS
jgi:hypothetical protein